MLTAGDTFFLPTPPDFLTKHLFIVISERNEYDEVLIVNVTTKKSHSDASCILRNGDHPFIKHESVANYADARAVKVSDLCRLIGRHADVSSHQSVSPELLRRIQEGALVSPALPTKYLKYISSDV